ncbi:MAG TPA: LON peptidase substrate-binding domain-containing protein [Gammaproteobacteria bacterium]|nr:LON peptidase substrate-binding domain-containing protein [Gammaproteobacteria bacterium]
MTEAPELPLFPLHTVLFPGGPLSLRIFEPRYLDMVSRCMRDDCGFGVCLIREGTEIGPVKMATVGTLARIVDWEPRDDGMLGIVARGEGRFSIEESWRRKDGLHLGRLATLPAEEASPLPAEWRPMVAMLRRLLAHFESQYQDVEPDFDDAGWVGCRFAELLPLPLAQKQVMLEMTNPLERLRMLRPLVESVRRRE